MQPFQLTALTPPGLLDPSIAIAASRAGGIGILDLEYVQDERAARAAIVRLARYAQNACGIRLDSQSGEFVAGVMSDLPEQVKVVTLTPGCHQDLRQQVQTFRTHNLTILLETTCLEQALFGEEVGVDGLIAKGHEAGGRVGEETTFILLQRLLARVSLPVWAQGGIGLHTVVACYAAGATGVLLDGQLALTRESPLPEVVKAVIARMDGSETICLGGELGETYRVYARPGLPALEELCQVARALAQDPRPQSEILIAWRQAVQERAGWGAPDRYVWLLGQDAAFAAPLAERFRTVGGVLGGMRQAIDAHVRAARALRPLDKGAPLARSHGTRYPIVQGPMTRVSDRAEFTLRVAEGGGLPFVALALMRSPEVKALLEETHHLLGDRPWGVGILGFVPIDLRQEQLEVIRAYRPPFVLIAGGRPDQARILEQEGIPTYLHVPSPGLLKMFIENGARRFVFEGRECGGHVGPRSSFVLWNTMIDVLLESLPGGEVADYHVLFAGGIHDALSASMVAAMAAPLAERGARIGVLLGTAYLFTKEIVATGAIVDGFQQEAIRCTRTVLLETGPGHATRCADTPYAEAFEREKRRLSREGKSAEDIRNVLEELNLGRLRIASKSVNRHPRYGQDPQAPKFTIVSEKEQHLEGLYMIGQVAALRDRSCTIEELHREISVKGSERLAELAEPGLARISAPREEQPCDVAIIGMACLLPKAPDLQTYWENILDRVDAITEVPKDRWDWRLYYDPDPKTRDKVYSKWGGFLDDVPFDPTRYGMPPNTLPSIEPLQLLTMEVVRAAIQDAGYIDRPFPRQRTSVILGVGGGAGDLGQQYAVRSKLPMFVENISPDVWNRLPEWTEDSFPGILLNVAAGRVANRFDLGGVNYTVDAACASSLAAIYLATRELEAGTSDMVIVGGADTVQNPFAFLCFSKTHALSPYGRCRTFDDRADGIVISEGVAMLVLKRLADAERDGDRIYAVIKGVGGSSDGRDKGLTAPRPEGQALALERAYAKAGFSPATVSLIEAHGTGTVAGDRAEVETLKLVFEAAGAARQGCAIGSVKSMIGHTKCTAGVAGLMKVALALYHKVLPPTINVEKPNPILTESPFYVNVESRLWIHGTVEHPRRAGVSAFGFGGTNFHAVIEEYTGDFLDLVRQAPSQHWPSELLLWAGGSRQELLEAIEPFERALGQEARPELHNLAYTLWQLIKKQPLHEGQPKLRLAVVATSLDDLRQKLASARQGLQAGHTSIHDPRGIYFTEQPLGRNGKIAFLFPGQGSQYPNMLRDLAIHFPEVRERFELADRVLRDHLPQPLSTFIFPPPYFSQEDECVRQQALTQTDVAQPALGVAEKGLFYLLQALGVRPDMVAGHSYGEYVALCAAGVFNEEVLCTLSVARGRSIIEAAERDLGTMAAVEAGPESIAQVLRSVEGVWIANRNAPTQTIISGTRSGVEEVVERLEALGIHARPVAVACAFHSPVVAPARDRLAKFLSTIEFAEPQLEVFSNTSAAPYPRDPHAIAALLAEHLVRPVEFVREVEAMYQAGARVFVEVGPRNVLTTLVRKILDGQPHLAVALDTPGQSSLIQLHHALGQLAVHSLPLQLDRLYQGRAVRRLDLNALEEETREKPLAPTTWLVNGGRARPLREASQRENTIESQTPATVAIHTATKTDLSPPLSVPEVGRQSPKPSVLMPEPVVPVQSDVTLGIPTPPLQDGETSRVMVEFQRLMNRFLETQQQVMLTYLRGSANGATSPEVSGVSTTPALSPLTSRPADPSQTSTHELTTLTSGSSPLIPSIAPDSTEASSPVVAVSTRAAGTQTDNAQLTRTLLQIVSERTGYPPEMLGLDLNVEADLGIDSIKRVEILGAFQRACFPFGQQRTQEAMEKLTRIKTLRGIVEWVSNALRADTNGQGSREAGEKYGRPGSTQPTTRPGAIGTSAQTKVPRLLLTATDAPLLGQPVQLALDRVFLITDDEQGIAQAMADELRHHGGRVALIRMGSQLGEMSQDSYIADMTDPVAVAELLGIVRQRQGPIGGVIHLLPLKTGTKFEEMDLAGWRERLHLEVKSLFYLARAAGPDLKQAGASGKGWLLAATAMGGTLAHDASGPDFFPGQGGITGLIKTLALEWPQVCCKVVDLDMDDLSSMLAKRLMAEIAAEDENVEVGYRGSRRLVVRTRPAPLDQDSPTPLEIDSSWVVLVTGGARGITAEVACELATRYRPTLLLVGRSPLPEAEESPETAGLTSPQELKAALMDRMRRAGQPVTPVRVEAAYARLLQNREMQNNLAVMQRTGATVRYYQVDVRDEQTFGSLIEAIYQSYGRLDGVIHGAGIIEDRLLEDKATDSFDRVFDTKADSAFILSRRVRSDSLKFLVFFSSVAGCFGNRGQGDYAAANEVLNKLAIHLDKRWLGRVVAINWGPWAKTGMVSAEVQRQFAERGVQLIPPHAGRRMFDGEILFGRKGQVEVVIGDGPWETVEAPRSSLSPDALPLLGSIPLKQGSGGAVEFIRTLDPECDRYLQDHRLDGKPVFPAAMAVELMAEVAQKGWPEWKVVGVRALRVLRGIILEDGPKDVRVVARSQTEPSQERLEFDVDVEITEVDRPGHPFYRATVHLAEQFPAPPPYDPGALSELHPFPMPLDEAYRRWLFHGPCFQAILRIEGISQQGISAILHPSSPAECLLQKTNGQWLIDPVLLDCGFQLAILWERAHHDMTPLPSCFASYRRFGVPSGSPIRCSLQVQSSAGGHVLLTDIYFLETTGRVIGLMQGMEFSCSKALNRLAEFAGPVSEAAS